MLITCRRGGARRLESHRGLRHHPVRLESVPRQHRHGRRDMPARRLLIEQSSSDIIYVQRSVAASEAPPPPMTKEMRIRCVQGKAQPSVCASGRKLGTCHIHQHRPLLPVEV